MEDVDLLEIAKISTQTYHHHSSNCVDCIGCGIKMVMSRSTVLLLLACIAFSKGSDNEPATRRLRVPSPNANDQRQLGIGFPPTEPPSTPSEAPVMTPSPTGDCSTIGTHDRLRVSTKLNALPSDPVICSLVLSTFRQRKLPAVWMISALCVVLFKS